MLQSRLFVACQHHDCPYLDGNVLAATLRDRLAERVQTLTSKGVEPCLAVILVGEDAASARVPTKVKARGSGGGNPCVRTILPTRTRALYCNV